MSALVERMPTVFFGHGSPMNALGGDYADAWRAFGEAFPRPRAILMVSAHWYVPETAVTAMVGPRTIHDFYGFPAPLYEIDYPAPGDPWLADRTAALLEPLDVRRDHNWGLDHGTWSVLMHAYPAADIPVVQLSIDRRQPPAFHYELGRRLAELRDEGVMIAGSGDVVHNLRAVRRDGSGEPYDWATRFNDRVKAAIAMGDHAPLIGWESLGEDARLSIPTDEHWLPLLYVLGAQGQDDEVTFFNDRIELGSISMLCAVIGASNPGGSGATAG
jgi:4,5-DOPA dioxygenase extradiol